MEQEKDYPGWFVWMWERGAVVFFGVFLAIFACIAGVAFYLDHRLGEVEERISFVPPRSYQPPSVDEQSVGDVDVATLPLQQLVYVPVYSHVYFQGGSPYSLEVTLSVRNTDTEDALYVKTVDYYDTSGKRVKSYLEQPIRLAPLQTIEFLVERRDSSGGSGANFLVDWCGDNELNKPLIEAVMVGTGGTQGICFSRGGVDINR